MSEPKPFSASDAAVDGVRLIRDHWRLLLGWALFNIVALLILVVVTVILSVILATLGGQPAVAILITLASLAGMAIQVMIVTAIYRTELRFDEPSFMHLRLGTDELRMLAVWMVLSVGALLYAGVATSVVAWIQRETNTPLAWVAGIAAAIAFFYVMLRLSMVAPMTFDTRKIQFAGGWRLAKGRVVPLLGMTVIALCVLGMAAVVGRILLYVAVGAASGFHDLGVLAMDEDSLKARPIAWTIQALGEVIYFPLLWALAVTPAVAAYKHFRKV